MKGVEHQQDAEVRQGVVHTPSGNAGEQKMLKAAPEGVFYGMGRTRGVFFVETGCMYGIRIFFTTLVTKVWHLDLQAVWTCMVADNIAKSLLLFLLYRRMVRERSRSGAVKNR